MAAKKLKSCQAWQSVSGDHIYLSCLRNIFWWSISSLTPACPTQTSLSWLGSRSEEESGRLHPIILRRKETCTFHSPPCEKVHTQMECLRQAPAPTRAAKNSQRVVSFLRHPAVLRSPRQSWKVWVFFGRKISLFQIIDCPQFISSGDSNNSLGLHFRMHFVINLFSKSETDE